MFDVWVKEESQFTNKRQTKPRARRKQSQKPHSRNRRSLKKTHVTGRKGGGRGGRGVWRELGGAKQRFAQVPHWQLAALLTYWVTRLTHADDRQKPVFLASMMLVISWTLGKGSNNQNGNLRWIFSMKGGVLSCTYLFWKIFIKKKHLESFPDCENVFCT